MARVLIEGLTKRFGDNAAVAELDLVVEEGEFLTLLGPSGCGKTTTLRCIAGLEAPDAGEISIGDDAVVSTRRRVFAPPEKRNLGMVFQSYALWPHMTVFGNVAYPLRMRRRDRDHIRRRVAETLELVRLQDYADRHPSQLSGGQQQRVALARAMAGDPRLLLFDEPLSNLDTKLRGRMRDLLLRLHRTIGTTSIYVTHDQLEALTLSDRIVVMNQGRIEQIGTPQELYAAPHSRFVADFVGFDNIHDGVVEDGRLRLGEGGPAVPLPATASYESGRPLTLAVRSSHVRLHPDRPGPEAFEAKIVNHVYLGDQVEYAVERAGLRFVSRGVAMNGSTPAVGAPVWVSVPPENVVLLEKGTR